MSAQLPELMERLIIDGTKVEVWKDVAGYEGKYQVSSFGRVKSLSRIVSRKCKDGRTIAREEPERILKVIGKGKYFAVRLYRGKKEWKDVLVHKLVLETFVGPCPDGMQCRHFPDRSYGNNRLENLQWGTPLENAEDKRAHGTDKGWKLSDETRAKMSMRMKNDWRRGLYADRGKR